MFILYVYRALPGVNIFCLFYRCRLSCPSMVTKIQNANLPRDAYITVTIMFLLDILECVTAYYPLGYCLPRKRKAALGARHRICMTIEREGFPRMRTELF